ncbi:GPI transamidase component GPI16 precursor [Pseudovirgaria hyperparasitica]|uniref:GPI transamidase component GPI16 n=1 Tax=Pseudovirgaria hyperparasitica TaxID=470096 RepID=A0A6A6WGY4_9PEZI|nr:GPI transamidase component GPI16 precursor [Pseudovirgaria hyperparasitica]KAF2760411.1 GPI transamidase component GPI16 precursor [Pseudovirgaria hyperparasitica]
MLFHFLFTLLVAPLHAAYAGAGPSDYHERLLLRPLPQSALLASFNFRSNTSASAFDQQNFRLFPRSLGQILQHTNTKELHLRFSVGRWDAESWGALPWNGAREGGTGVELWAWLEADSEEQANAQWLTLTNTLSGLFCASLNFIDSTKTIRPVMSFQPEGSHSESSLSSLHLLHGTLPHEVVCTENLTPFLKLLPCKGKAGISSLFDGHKLFDASWQTMSIDVRPVCPADGSECILEMEQTVDMVLDIERSKRPRENPIPRPGKMEDLVCDSSKHYSAYGDACYPLHRSSDPTWSLTEVFGRPIKGSCHLADLSGEGSETICINVPPEREVRVNTSSSFSEHRHEDGFLRCYKLSNGDDFDLELPDQTLLVDTPLPQPHLYAARSINGYGQERGSVQAVINNPSTTSAIDFVYLESLPWFMKPYLHTLHASVSSSSATNATSGAVENPIVETYYRPAVDRHRGTHLELLLSVPPASTLTLTYDFDKAILRYTEYPPDANRGFDVAPAVIRLLSPKEAKASRGAYLRTTSLLLPLPTPDFSMPYNVIILTSTVMALGFGSIFNPLVRRFVAADEVASVGPGGLKGFIRAKFTRLVARFASKGTKSQ